VSNADDPVAQRREQLTDDLVDGDILMTGFPGFIAGRLLEELFVYQTDVTVHLLVEPSRQADARQRLDELRDEHPEFEGDFELHPGDITDPKLGVPDETYQSLADSVEVVWHLAALYDLAVAEEPAYRVNVRGTVHVLDFCDACKNLRRFNYVSTCYVSGERNGKVYEDELDEGQGHNNHYESTKFWAEMEVQRRMDQVPTAIFRPGIVVGDSNTGETDKYDGPYYVFQLLDRLPDWVPMPNIGDGEAMVNLVPVDFVTEAMAFLGLKEDAAGTVYQLADPHPMRASDILAEAADCLGRAGTLGRVPARLVEGALRSQTVERLAGVPRQAISYFNRDAVYDASHTQRALKDTDIRCPHLSSYLPTLIAYYQAHPEAG
jgi:thioester reductase-like protein